MSKEYLTKEQAEGLLEDVIGRTITSFKEEITTNQNDMQKAFKYALSHAEPKPVQKSEEEVRRDFGHLICCLAQEKGNRRDAIEVAKQHGFDFVAKALGTATVAAGGALVIPEFSPELVPLLRAKSVVRESGARSITMKSGIMSMGRVGTGATSSYRGESAAGGASQPALEELELRARILTTMVPASTQLLNRAGGASSFIGDDMIASARDKADSTFIRSDGSSNTPRGLLYWAKTAHKFNETNAAGTNNGSTLAEITVDLGKMMRFLMDANVPKVSPGWLMAPRTWQRLFTERDGNGNQVFRDEMAAGKLYGIPFKDTTNIPINLAGSPSGTAASELYLAEFSNVIIGDTEMLTMSVSTEGSYTVSGSLVSAFERGEVLFRVEQEHDLIERHGGDAIVVLQALSWGS